ncbi:MAG: enoyl-CoA hydratase/isomerase family protein [Pirellulaceae bacterium]
MITVKVNGQTGTIILDQPARCNALSREMVAQLSEALDDLRQQKSVRGIVLTGAGAHFCAGIDLKQWQESTSSEDSMQQWYRDAQAIQAVIEQMLQLPKPIVAAVDGATIGTGFALVLACDLVVASGRATFSVPAPKLGLVSGLVAPLLAFRAGAAVASHFLIGGSELSASEAKNLGLVQYVVEAEQVWVRASNWIDTISMGAAESLQLTKKLLNEMVGEQMLTMLSSGAAVTATALTTEAAAEGLAAFKDKRSPKFPG